jgi:transposase-like protein
MDKHPIDKWMKTAATRDFLADSGECEHCGSTNLVCVDRVFLGSSMFEGFKCSDCNEFTNHEIENY